MASTRVVDELRRRGGVGAWGAVAAATSTSAVGRAVASTSVALALPGVLVLTDLLADPAVRVEACLLCAGEGAQLSHLSALQRHGLPVPEHLASAVHVLVPHRRRRRSQRETPPAVVGIQTVRFPHSRLTGDAAGCRESAWRTVQVRRTELLGTALPHLVPLAEPAGADGPRLRLELPHRS